ncbi:MAG TPA: SCO family protein [Dyella sp.]|uniref:SCO family protein n=1 Tax=Dyella sp. TaxID=1869338 RepID=UPI002D787D82|nr:SCO family protein [Dyella sp.]HET6552793.1 SCO family protein [Dyella sp.]
MKRVFVLLLLLISAVATAGTDMPKDSTYQLKVELTDQAGHTWPLSSRSGRVQLVSMFYTSCTMVCPMIVDTMQITDNALDEPSRARMDMLLVSFDPARDSVDALRQYAERRKLHAPAWTLARVSAQDARQLAALLGLQYRQLPGGDFNHSSELILLDAEGRLIARTSIIGRADPEFVAAVRKATAGP